MAAYTTTWSSAFIINDKNCLFVWFCSPATSSPSHSSTTHRPIRVDRVATIITIIIFGVALGTIAIIETWVDAYNIISSIFSSSLFSSSLTIQYTPLSYPSLVLFCTNFLLPLLLTTSSFPPSPSHSGLLCHTQWMSLHGTGSKLCFSPMSSLVSYQLNLLVPIYQLGFSVNGM